MTDGVGVRLSGKKSKNSEVYNSGPLYNEQR